MPDKSRIVALWCWYHGAAFRGYQSQPLGPTVQDTLKAALRDAGFERDPVPAGRTDLGVHARMQVASLRVPVSQPIETLAARVNAALPRDVVGIAVARDAPRKFHAQWQSVAKEYRYRLLLADDLRWAPYAWRVDVDPKAVLEQLQLAVGTRDFIAFHDKSSPQLLRTLSSVELAQLAPHTWELKLKGPGFARYMVRYLVGSSVAVARGEVSASALAAGLEHGTAFKGVKAPAQGLILWEVHYPPAMDPFGNDRAAPGGLPLGPPFEA